MPSIHVDVANAEGTGFSSPSHSGAGVPYLGADTAVKYVQIRLREFPVGKHHNFLQPIPLILPFHTLKSHHSQSLANLIKQNKMKDSVQ